MGLNKYAHLDSTYIIFDSELFKKNKYCLNTLIWVKIIRKHYKRYIFITSSYLKISDF